MSKARSQSNGRPQRPAISRIRRVGTGVAVAFVSLLAAYALLINVFLSSSLFDRVINADPRTLFVTYERGWSWWPGRVHASNLVLRASDSNVEWQLRIESCTFDVSFFDLASQKKFHLTRVRGSGVSFEARRRISAPEARPEHVDALPSIPGFPRIPLVLQDPPDLAERWDDAHWDLFTIELEDVIAKDVREIWVDTMRFEGNASVSGRFYLKPIRKARIGPIHVDVEEGRVLAQDRPLLAPVVGTLDLDIAAFDPRTTDGDALLRALSTSVDVHGRVPELANIPERWLGPVKLTGGADVRRLALRVEDGSVRDGGHIDVAAPASTVEVLAHRAVGDFVARADIESDSGRPRAMIRIDGEEISARRIDEGDETLLFRAPKIELTADAYALDLSRPLGDLHAAVVVPEGEVPDARAFDAYVSEDTEVGIEGGHARTRGRAEAWLDKRYATAETTIEADELDVRVAKTRLRGQTTLEASMEAWRWENGRVENAKARVRVAEGSIATVATPKRGVVDVRGLEIALDAPEIDLIDPLRAFHATIEMPRAELVDHGLLASYLPRGPDVHLVKGHARFDARADLDVRDHRASGTVDLHAARLGFELRDFRFVGDATARARVRDWAWPRGDLVVDEAKGRIERLEAHRVGRALPSMTIPRVFVDAKSARFELSDPLARLDLRVRVQGADVTDPAAVNVLLPRDADVALDVAQRGGRVDADLDAKVVGRVARGSLSVQGTGVGIRGLRIGVLGTLDARADVDAWNLAGERMRVGEARFTMTDAEVRFGCAEAASASRPADARVRRAALEARAGELDLAHPSLRGVDYRIVVDDAIMEDARRASDLFPELPADLEIQGGSARGSADITVVASEGKASGGAVAVVERARIRLGDAVIGGNGETKLVVHGFEGGSASLNLSGSQLVFRDVYARSKHTQSNEWSGEVTFLQAGLALGMRPRFDGFANLRGDDARPILALVLGSGAPEFASALLAAPELSGQARMTVERDRASIRDMVARGGDTTVRGHYVTADDARSGAFKIDKGPFAVGLSLGSAGERVRFFRLETWLKDQEREALALFEQAGSPERGRARDARRGATSKAEARTCRAGDAGRALSTDDAKTSSSSASVAERAKTEDRSAETGPARGTEEKTKSDPKAKPASKADADALVPAAHSR